MEQLIAKMKDYLQMEAEIEYKEFVDYYQQVVDLLQNEFQGMEQDALVKLGAITQIIGINAVDRSKQKNENSKKFKKMAEKSQFWYDAIAYKLNKEFGMNKMAFEEESGKVFED